MVRRLPESRLDSCFLAPKLPMKVETKTTVIITPYPPPGPVPVEQESPTDGVLTSRVAEPGEQLQVGSVISR